MNSLGRRAFGRVRPWTGPLAWSVFLLWRAPGWPLFGGAPVSPLMTAALGLVWWLWSVNDRRLPGVRWVLVLALAKLLIAPVILERGFRAAYFANGNFEGSPEVGLYFPHRPFTRIDRRLSFGSPGGDELPVFFLNDAARFRTVPADGNGVSVEWSGYLNVQRSETRQVYLKGVGVSANISIDGLIVATMTPTEREKLGTAVLRAGPRRCTVRVTRADGTPGLFEAGFQDPVTGTRRPFDAADVFSERVSRVRLIVDRVGRLIAWSIDGLAVVLFVASVYLTIRTARLLPMSWRRIAVAAAALFALGEALWFLRAFHDHVILLSRGDDWLTYESYARDIVLHGPLMTNGAPLGHGQSFYYQVLYPYFLAGTHILFGESLWGAFFFQRLFETVTVLACWRTADRLFGPAAGLGTAFVAVWFVLTEIDPLTRIFLSENLFVPLVSVSVASLARVAVVGPRRTPIAAGLWGGLATLARSTLLAAWPIVALLLVADYRRARRSLWPLAGMFALMGVLSGLATLRNAIVAHEFVPITSGLGVNLKMGNPAPPGYPRHDPAIRGRLSWLTADPQTLDVLEEAVEAPGPFLRGLARKAAFALGWFRVLESGAAVAYDGRLIFTWSAALAGMVLLALGRAHVANGSYGIWIPAAVAASHFAVVVLIFPNVYGTRLILPMYVLLLPYVGLCFGAAWSAGTVRLRGL